MGVAIWFWIIWVLCLLFGGGWGLKSGNYVYLGGGLVTWILIGLLGYAIFGAPIK